MKVLVPVKRVVDFNVKIRVKSDGSGVEFANIKMSMNPFDEIAVEEAIRLKEGGKATEIVAVSIGPAQATETIRTALAMGADRGVLLQSDTIPPDGLEVARALTAELKDGGYDLILFGKMAIDDYNHQVGPMAAELLGLPCVTAITHLEIENGKGRAEREIEGGVEVLEFPLPALLTTDKGLNEPRYPALKGIMAAKKKPLEIKPTAFGVGALEIVAMMPPPERKAGKVVGEGAAAVPELVRLLREEAKVL
jgi:electron transfer flavoprotein beta subunit